MIICSLEQDVQRKAREEAISVLGDDEKDTTPTLEQTKKFAYIDMIIKEVRYERTRNRRYVVNFIGIVPSPSSTRAHGSVPRCAKGL